MTRLFALLFLLFFFNSCAFSQKANLNDDSSMFSEFVYETAPFPECHASTVAITSQGPVAAWFGGTEEKNKDVEIWVSYKNGNTWSVPMSVADGRQNDGSRHPCWNPVLYQEPTGALLLFYKVGPNPRTWWGEMKRSHDQGRTWQDHQVLPHGGIGPVKNKPVMLSDGSLLCPSSTEHEQDGWRVHFESTRDGGNTWSVFPAINDATQFNIIQPSVLLHGGGKLQLLARSKEDAIITSWSTDFGKSWSAPEPIDLPNPNSGIDAVTLQDGRHLLIYNHTRVTPGKWGGPRSPLNLAISDDGLNWSAVTVLESDPGEYSYPAIVQDEEGLVHITYTWKRKKVKYVRLDPQDFELTPMLDGAWPGK